MIICSHEIDLWFAYDEHICNPQLMSRYQNLLNDEERLQQKRFYFEKHCHQYLITRALVRTVLSLYENKISPEKWHFIKNKYGKPFISNCTLSIPINFNISHTDKLVIVAVTLGQKIGVDVEYMLKSGKTVELAESFFSPTEVQQLRALLPENQKDCFFDFWTLKEAYIKVCGMGLSIPLNHFSYSFSKQGKINISFEPERNDHPDNWQFWLIHPNNFHKVSVALKNDKSLAPHSICMREIVPLWKIKKLIIQLLRDHLFDQNKSNIFYHTINITYDTHYQDNYNHFI